MTSKHNMYLNAKVNLQEQEFKDQILPPQEKTRALPSMFKELLDLISPQVSNNQKKSTMSISRVTCGPTERMNPSSASPGRLKNQKDVDTQTKGKERESSVTRPRAVLSSPENDVLIGSIKDLNIKVNSSWKRNQEDEKKVAGVKNSRNQMKEKDQVAWPPRCKVDITFKK